MDLNPDLELNSVFLMTLGGLLLLGLVTSFLGNRTLLPRVTLLLLLGVSIGQEGLQILPVAFVAKFEIIAQMTLMMVGFLLGSKLTRASLGGMISHVLWISLSAALVTTIIVAAGLMLIGAPTQIAILLGCIASATAPAAILDIVSEAGSKGPFKNLLLSIVALDDAWALMLFGVGITLALPIDNGNIEFSSLITSSKHIGGAVLLGLSVGIPAAYLTGRLKPGQPMLSEALGIVFVCGGLALWLDFSYLIAAMVLGATVANLAKHHEHPFHSIEGIEEQFKVIFFVLAGASLEVSLALEAGLLGTMFIALRTLGKILGARIGAQFAGADEDTKAWMGVALLPQAGVAIGMALVAGSYFPQHSQLLLTVVVSSTVIFELVGPIFTRIALRRVDHNQSMPPRN